jgi:hypothetical protein
MWCKACSKEYAATYYRNNAEKLKRGMYASSLRRLYGISPEQVEELLERQSHSCAICGAAFGSQTPHIDHNHATGEVRGLLCHKCNTALGLFMDDPVNIRAALGYLESKGSYGRQASAAASV